MSSHESIWSVEPSFRSRQRALKTGQGRVSQYTKLCNTSWHMDRLFPPPTVITVGKYFLSPVSLQHLRFPSPILSLDSDRTTLLAKTKRVGNIPHTILTGEPPPPPHSAPYSATPWNCFFVPVGKFLIPFSGGGGLGGVGSQGINCLPPLELI